MNNEFENMSEQDMQEQEKPFTWDDLAEAISKLPADERKKIVQIQIEDQTHFLRVVGLEVMQEDIYVNKDDSEDCATLEELKELHDDQFVESDYELSTPKGTPFLWDGFEQVKTTATAAGPDKKADELMQGAKTFKEELTELINRHSKENGSNTPDFILAMFLTGAADVFDVATNERSKWYSYQV